MKTTKNIILALIVSSLAFSSCISIMYGSESITRSAKCDTMNGKLFLRITNTGKIGISSLSLNTDSGEFKYGGLLPGETTCYFPIKPIYKRPGYKIHLLRFNTFGETETRVFNGIPIDHIGDLKLTHGFYTLKVNLGKKKGDINVHQFEIIFDRDKI